MTAVWRARLTPSPLPPNIAPAQRADAALHGIAGVRRRKDAAIAAALVAFWVVLIGDVALRELAVGVDLGDLRFQLRAPDVAPARGADLAR